MAYWDVELEATSYYQVEADTEEEAVAQAIQQARSDLTHEWKPLFVHEIEEGQAV